ncbi:hypothetical protein B9Z55_021487 [Caenorhabditis nigoni]|nr:hypothetical protein B9Z55_021487 [Caenorhabditis nigoni]
MHELEWSPNLQDILTNLEFEKIPEESGRNWRFTMISGYQNGIEELEKSENSKVKMGQSEYIWYNPRFEHIMPYQTSVACAKKGKLFQNFKILCLLGPKSVLRKSKTGDAGSGCLDGYQNDNGMCRRVGKKTQTGTNFTTNDPTTQKQEIKKPGSKQVKFIQKLNEKRREYAVKWNVSNMHELSWNVTSKSNWTKFNIESDDYGKELEQLEAKIQENKTIEDFELLDPMKFEIRCGYYNKTPPLYCIFAPGKTTTNYIDGIPGSNCQDGFENNHGLCSLATTKTITMATPPGPTRQIPENFLETRTLPKELEDYVEVDGDDYDEDFPTGEPPLDSGFENCLQFWNTVLVVFGPCFFGFFDLN